MTASAPEFIGMLVSCGAAATALLARDARLRYAAAVVAIAAAPALVLGNVWDTSRVVSLRHPPEKLAAVCVAAVVAAAIVGAIFRRYEWAFPIAAFAVLPLRVPVTVGGQTAHLLVPLYLVIAGGVLSYGYAALRGTEARQDGAPPAHAATVRPLLVTWLYRVLAATLVLYAIQTFYSDDVSNAIENASFFLVPFALLFAMFGDVRWSDRLLTWILVTVTAVALVFAGVAFWEYAARDLLLSRGDLLASNQLHLYFRVNSLFYDPNILGRDLALVLVALGAYLAWARSGRLAAVAAVSAGILLAALALSFSITGFVALVAGLLVVMALRWGLRRAIGAGLAIVAAAAIFAAVSGVGRTDLSSTDKINTNLSAGRVSLITGGYDLTRDRPVYGWGSGSFGKAFKDHVDKHAQTTVSHSEPLTVGAEQGAIGLVVYAALIVLSLLILLPGARESLAATAVAGCYIALFVHSLGYADFSVDPAMWALLGVAVALRLRRSGGVELPAPDPAGQPPARDPRPATA